VGQSETRNRLRLARSCHFSPEDGETFSPKRHLPAKLHGAKNQNKKYKVESSL